MSSAPIEHADGLPQPQRNQAVLTIALGIIMAVVDSAIANVALPTIAADLDASPAFSIWIVNGYQLAITISLLPLASLGEIVGYRRVYLAGLVLFTLASAFCALAHTLPLLTIARIIQGLRRGRHHERQRGTGALHLPAQPARSRHRDQRARRRLLGRGRPDARRRHPGGRHLALAVRHQRPARVR